MTGPLVSISIMAGPNRADLVPALIEALGGDVPVAMDPRTDRRRDESVWPVRRMALDLRDPSARFHLVVQDDAVIGRDFHARLAALLEAGGDRRAYCLYYRHKSRRHNGEMNAAATAGRSSGGFVYRRLMWGIAVVLPSWAIDDLVEGCEARTDVRQDDVRMRYHLRSIGMKTFYPLPSLVSHRPELSGRNGPNRGRQSLWFE